MSKLILLLLSILTISYSFTILGHTFFETESNDEALHLGDQILKGTSITSDIQTKIKTIV
jgi:hypothetical protein